MTIEIKLMKCLLQLRKTCEKTELLLQKETELQIKLHPEPQRMDHRKLKDPTGNPSA